MVTSQPSKYISLLALFLLVLGIIGSVGTAIRVVSYVPSAPPSLEVKQKAEKWSKWLAESGNYSDQMREKVRDDLIIEWSEKELPIVRLGVYVVLSVFSYGLLYRRNWGRLGVGAILSLAWIQSAYQVVYPLSVIDREVMRLNGWRFSSHATELLYLVVLAYVILDVLGQRGKSECCGCDSKA